MAYAYNRGVTLVGAAGNNYADMVTNEEIPAGYQDFIAVGAIDNTITRANFSNYGDRLDVVAPGVNVLSTTGYSPTEGWGSACPVIDYCFAEGTSMATPYVSGLAALMLSVNPGLTPEQIRQIIRNTALDLGTPGQDVLYGYGLPQADAAVAASANPTVLTPYIGQPLYLDTISGVQAITGSVSGPNLKDWSLQVGAGEVPTAWTTIASGSSAVTSESTLANFNTYSLPNSTYTLRMVATNQAGQAYYFNVYDVQVSNVSDTTPPSQPTNVSGAATDHSVNLTWTAATDNVGVLNYVVKRNGVVVGSPTGTSFIDSGLQPNTTYVYTVTAVDLSGNNSTPSAAYGITTSSDVTPPTVPTGLSATSITDSQINLTWTVSTDNVAVAGYRIFRDGTQIGTSTVADYNDTGLNPDTPYSYTVTAYDAQGNVSAASSILAVSTAQDVTAPSVPANLHASQVSYTSLTLNWAASTDNVAVTGYRVYRNGVQVATTAGTSYTVNGLSPGTNYSFSLTAYDARINLSAFTTALNVSTIAAKVGDVNLDGMVNIFDLSSLLSHYNTNFPAADFDHNGIVNIFDLSALLAHFGT